MSVNPSVRNHVVGTCNNARSNLDKQVDFVEVADKVSDVFAGILNNPDVADEPASFFVAMSHSAFLAAIALALSGQSPPMYMASRGSLEAAMYAFWITGHPETWEIWKNRQDSEEARRKARKAFEIGPMMAELDITQPACGNQFRKAYNSAIDFGAHPNYLALLTNLEEDEAGEMQWMYVSPDRLMIRQGLHAATHFGLTALAVLAHTFEASIKESDTAQDLVGAFTAWGEALAPTEEV